MNNTSDAKHNLRYSSILRNRERVLSQKTNCSLNFDDKESLIETVYYQRPQISEIQAEPFLLRLTTTEWGCHFLREKKLLRYLKTQLEDDQPETQKKILTLLSQVAVNQLGAALLTEQIDLLDLVLNRLVQHKVFSLKAYVFAFANALVKNENGRRVLGSKKFDWSVRLVSKRKMNEVQDHYVAVHKYYLLGNMKGN